MSRLPPSHSSSSYEQIRGALYARHFGYAPAMSFWIDCCFFSLKKCDESRILSSVLLGYGKCRGCDEIRDRGGTHDTLAIVARFKLNMLMAEPD
eukprot:6210342-Pleurochrysis_carterae.AAC.1